MFLKRMNVKGFKSFAFPTKIDFTDGLTVVVGPNGSGKSNINDAFRWVLGEASKKNLRASAATDMIFSGADNAKPAEYAEVTLVFNNESRILNIDTNEVYITRRNYRSDKQNEYYINKNLVRRKDVKDLFLGTGLGNTDLSIISQGSVTQVAESKSKDLRVLLDEAAGVSRYKIQKEESVRKLEKVNQSLDILSVKLKELEKQVGPLKKKKEIAEKYLSIKDQLSKIELPIIKNDLTKNVELREKLNNEIEDSALKRDLAEETLKKIEIKLKELQEKSLNLDSELYSLQNKQNELNQQSIITENDEKSLEEAIKKSVKGLKDINDIKDESFKKQEKLNEDIKQIRKEEFDLITKRDQIYQGINKAEYEVKKSSKSKSGSVSRGTQVILDNKGTFNEIYGTIGELITFDKKYETAIQNSLGNKLSNIIVSDEKVVKDAISFLKANKAGTATFMPLKKIVPKSISLEYENALKKIDGYLGTVSSIIKINSKFKNIVNSIGGRILLFENIDTALNAAKMLNYRYEIVTVDGDQIFTGFTIRGGSNFKGNKINELKRILEELRKQYKNIKEELYNKQEEIQSLRDSLSFIQTEITRSQDRLSYLESNLQKLLDQYELVTGKKYNLKSFKDSEEYISSDLSIEQINNRIKSIQLEKQSIQKEVMNKQDEEYELRRSWQEYVSKNTDATVSLSKIINLISKDLEILNKDYKMTYETFLEKEVNDLKVSLEEAGPLREKLRKEISKLGYVDFDSINNYEELFESYETLKKDVDELKESKEKLLSTIEIMDQEMIKQFSETFEKVNERFKIVFSTLFRGGKAQIICTEPEDILNTGVEIEAKMPGKTIKSISLYSGGEKSLISLSLIFAINQVRNLPILMLDEVEAALDEANVDRFARFAKKLNETTQIVITSHRPGTMEQADVLYGVTMQTKGITSIVSVKLADAIDLAE